MTKPAISLDLVQIASPCHVAWDDMAGDDRRRFCRQCKLHVYDLSDMPRAEAQAFVNQAEGRTCIRLFRRDDGTLLTRDCPVGLRALRQRLVRAVASLVGLVLALVTGTLLAGRLKVGADLNRPARTYAEWIEPGSTQPAVMGIMACPTPLLQTPPVLVPSGPTSYEAPESSLPEPTAEQLEAIAERLK